MKQFLLITIFLSLSIGFQAHGQSKWLRKAKEKLERKGDKAVDDLLNGKKKGNDNGNGTNSGNAGGGNGSFGGLNGGRNSGAPGERNNTPPPVNQSIDEAQNAISSSDYSDTRYYIQQALWGIEYEIGKELLNNMPSKVAGASSDEANDVISSSGIGFVGMTIQRSYEEGKVSILANLLNGSAGVAGYNAVLSNPGLYNSSDSDYKTVRVNGYKAVLEYTSSGYTIAIPFGQSSAFVLETSGLGSEEDAINAAGNFNIDEFKKVLGEQ
ncbi:MAG: hypothetical protein AAFO69_10025 [Bacteroidota bacterium]